MTQPVARGFVVLDNAMATHLANQAQARGIELIPLQMPLYARRFDVIYVPRAHASLVDMEHLATRISPTGQVRLVDSWDEVL